MFFDGKSGAEHPPAFLREYFSGEKEIISLKEFSREKSKEIIE